MPDCFCLFFSRHCSRRAQLSNRSILPYSALRIPFGLMINRGILYSFLPDLQFLINSRSPGSQNQYLYLFRKSKNNPNESFPPPPAILMPIYSLRGGSFSINSSFVGSTLELYAVCRSYALYSSYTINLIDTHLI